MKVHSELLVLREKEKQITSQFLEKLQLMEDKRLYLKLGYSSLFDYLVRAFGYSESAAYQRQSCLRLSCEIPEIKEKIESGRLSFSALSLAYKTLKSKPIEEKRMVLQMIENKSTREVKKLLLEPAKPIKIKKQVYSDKVILRLELSLEQNAKLEKLKALKSHRHDLETLLEKLVDSELKKYESKACMPIEESGTYTYKPKCETGISPYIPKRRSGTSTNTPKQVSETSTYTSKQESEKSTYKPKQVSEKSTYKPKQLLETSTYTSKQESEKSYCTKLAITNPRRRYVPRRLRNDVLNRAKYKCQYPGCEEDHYLQIDHVIPVRNGGLATIENLQVLCGAHNRQKG